MDLNPLVLWEQMTILNKGVIIILIVLSIWSLYVTVERADRLQQGAQAVARVRQAGDRAPQERPAAGGHRRRHEVPPEPPGPRRRGRPAVVPVREPDQPALRAGGRRGRQPRRRARHAAHHLGLQARHRLAGDDRHHHPLHRPVRHRDRHHQRLPRHGAHRLGRYRRGVGRYRRGARRHRHRVLAWPFRPPGCSTTSPTSSSGCRSRCPTLPPSWSTSS